MLKTCSRCHSKLYISNYQLNRKREYFKTCNRCRKVEMPRNRRIKEPKVETFDKSIIDPFFMGMVDERFAKEYEDEFNIKANDIKYKHFTFQEQVERYVKMMNFWKERLPNQNPDDIDDAMVYTEYLFVSGKIAVLQRRINILEPVLQDAINNRSNQKTEDHEDKLTDEFVCNYNYPDYEVVQALIKKNVEVWAEYSEKNHLLADAIWCDICLAVENSFLKEYGITINSSGGFKAMSAVYSAINMAAGLVLDENNYSYKLKNEIQYTMCKKLEKAWDGIGEWKC